MQIRQAHIGKDVEMPAAGLSLVEAAVGISHPPPAPAAGRQKLVGLLVLEARQRHLFEVVGTLDSPCRLAGCLDRRKQQGDKNSEDRNHHEQLNQRKTALS